MSDPRILHGLLQWAFISATEHPHVIEAGHGTWSVLRISPGTRAGKVWVADFIDPLQAEDFIVSQCAPPEDHVR